MKGDILKIKPHHAAAARAIYDIIAADVAASARRYVVAVGGESGAGKSEIAAELARVAGDAGVAAVIIQQDDYFVLPPQSNHRRRREDFSWVGPAEVRLALLDEDLARARERGTLSLTKPLSLFAEDRLASETLDLEGVALIIVEGTYVTSLAHVDRRVFIDRDFHATLAARRERGRDVLDAFAERVLSREHDFIAPLKAAADIIVGADYAVTTA